MIYFMSKTFKQGCGCHKRPYLVMHGYHILDFTGYSFFVENLYELSNKLKKLINMSFQLHFK